MPKSLKIVIDVITPEYQRYPTTGDWTILRGQFQDVLRVSVSNMDDWRLETLVGLHEAIEAVLCYEKGVDPVKVDKFDVAFERSTENGNKFTACGCSTDGEPGDDYHAPYYKQHQLATSVERMLAAELGVSWNEYEDACGRAHARSKPPNWDMNVDKRIEPPKTAPPDSWMAELLGTKPMSALEGLRSMPIDWEI